MVLAKSAICGHSGRQLDEKYYGHQPEIPDIGSTLGGTNGNGRTPDYARFFRLTLELFKFIALDLTIESGTLDTQRLGTSALVPVEAGQGCQDVSPFDFSQ